MNISRVQPPLKRAAGILMPISSLPGKYGIGTFGRQAYEFADFLKKAGQSYWQVLPLGPTSYGDSPYQSFSAYAGNPYFIDPDMLASDGLLSDDDLKAAGYNFDETSVDYEWLYKSRFKTLKKAFSAFKNKFLNDPEYIAFCSENSFWLDDYSLFMAIKLRFDSVEWLKWPREYRFKEKDTVERFKSENADEIDFWKFCQFEFVKQWKQLKSYSNGLGIEIIGDIPIYVALDSSDVWTNADQFILDENHIPKVVSGVPPDNFSATGQLWGNPIYDWDSMERDGFQWWKNRMAWSAKLYDIIRIDHFIGIVRYYKIPFGDKTAENGEYAAGPGGRLIEAITGVIGDKKIIAEDLGVLIPQVTRLRESAGFPGMKILEFGFDSDSKSGDLPCNYEQNTVVYIGTHDNDTIKSFFDSAPAYKRDFAKKYLNANDNVKLPDAAIKAAFASAGNTVILQLQDWLELGGEARMNFPSTIGQNWKWRVKKEYLTDMLAQRISDITRTYNRM